MTVREFVGIVRRRIRLIGGVALGVVMVVAILSLIATPMYDATATLFVSIRGSSETTDLQLVQSERSDSYAEIATSRQVLSEAAGTPEVERSVTELEESVSAIHPQQSVLIRVTARDADPEQAAVIANAVAKRTAKRVEWLERPAGRPASESPIHLSVAQTARIPESPTSPKVARNIVLGLFGGILFGLVAGIIREMFDRRLRDPAQIPEQFDLPVLTAVDFDRALEDRPMLIDFDRINEDTISQQQLAEIWRQSNIVEEFRTLRAGLQFFDFQNRPSIMVTSSAASEGKTTVAGNLAVTSALAGESVLVIDCDLRRPSVSQGFGVKREAGLTEVLIGQVDLDEALVEGRRLSVLPSGTVPPNPTELLGSQAMADLLEELHGRFQRIIVDTPPCLPFADASVLAPLCGATLVVVRMGSTTDEQFDRSVRALTSARARICGVAANMTSPRSSNRYGYYYEYGGDSVSGASSASGFSDLTPRAPREGAGAGNLTPS